MAFIPTHDTLNKYLSDMSAAERHLLESLKNQKEDTEVLKFPLAAEMVATLHTTTVSNLEELEILVDQFDGSGRASFKEAVTMVTGTALGMASKLRTHSVSKMLRDDYVSLNMNAIGYTMLHATGLALDSPPTAQLALAHLKKITPLIMRLSQVVIPIVIQELSTTTRTDPSIGERALSNIRGAWGISQEI